MAACAAWSPCAAIRSIRSRATPRSGPPLRGAKITDFVRDKQTSTLKYDLRGKTYSIEYTMNKDGTFTFVYTDADGERTTETHRRREKGKDKGKPKKDERE